MGPFVVENHGLCVAAKWFHLGAQQGEDPQHWVVALARLGGGDASGQRFVAPRPEDDDRRAGDEPAGPADLG
jgi:hypothetical protein